jgi:hypothetical protein
MDKDYVSWMVYNYAVQQSHDFVGRFRPYLFFGVATGAATLDSDPNNLVGGTVPKSATEISHILVNSFSICDERGLLWLNYRMRILDLQVNLG